MLSGIFDASELVVRNYDRAADDLIQDFLVRGLGLADTAGFNVEPGSVNRSLTETEVALMRAMAPIFKSRGQARVASDAMIHAPAHAGRRPTISRRALEAIEQTHADDLAIINALLPNDPIALASDRIVISEEAEPELSEAEQVLATVMAGLIRAADLKRFQ